MRITVKQAAEMMDIGEQRVRVMVQRGQIPGASCGGTDVKRSYFITDTQVERVMKGVIGSEET